MTYHQTRVGHSPDTPQLAPEFPAHHKESQHSSVNVGSVMRSTGKMILAGWLIDKLKLSDPLHRTFAYAAAGIGVGYVESLI
jgi:hypothetical protein